MVVTVTSFTAALLAALPLMVYAVPRMPLVSFGIFVLFQRYSAGRFTTIFSSPGLIWAWAHGIRKHPTIMQITIRVISRFLCVLEAGLLRYNRFEPHGKFIPVGLRGH